jgi:hypothetical protein
MNKKTTSLIFMLAAMLFAIPIQAQTFVNKQVKTNIKEMVSGPRKAVHLKKAKTRHGDELPITIDVLPYKNALNTFDLFREFIVIDNNGDNTTWIWSEYNHSVLYSNGMETADDWLISPAIKLEAGKFYHFAIDAMCNAPHYPEKFEVKIGTAPTVSGMTQSVIDETTVENTALVTYEQENISVAETGYYHFGIHAISDADMWYLTVANFLVEKGASPTAPAAVTDLHVTQIPDENKVNIRFKAPTTAINGNKLTSNIAKIVILRDGEPTITIEDIAPGSEQHIEDIVPKVGKHTYQVLPYDAGDPGEKSELVEILISAPLDVPYTLDFSENLMDLWKIIDNNHDGVTWQWGSNAGTYYEANNSNAADDYLITLPFNLKAGKKYDIFLSANTVLSQNPEKFEIKIGKEATVEGLTRTIIPATTITNTAPDVFEGSFFVDEDGKYYIAIHALSDANGLVLTANTLTIEYGAEPTSPAAISDLTATSGAQGALGVNLSFTAPTLAVDGSPLSGALDVKIFRDNELLHTLTGVSVGSAQTWKDTHVEDGKTYTYYLVAYNESGKGEKSAKVSAYVGQDVMLDVTNLQVKATTASTITFAWDEVKGAKGGYINTANVQYTVLCVSIEPTSSGDFLFIEEETLGSVVGKTTGTFDYAVDEGEQVYRYFAVKAINGEKSTNVSTDSYTYWLVGTPHDLPMVENFAEGILNYDTWELFGSEDVTAMFHSDASDGDGWGLFLTTIDNPAFVMLKSGKINLKDAENPTLLFDTKGKDITKAVVLGSTDDSEWIEIQEIDLTSEYATAKVPLPKSERFTRFAIGANIVKNSVITGFDQSTLQNTYEWNDLLFFDNIKVVDFPPYDLAISVEAPKTITAGQKATISATIENKGENAANSFTLKMTAGEKVLLHKTVNRRLLSFDKETFSTEFSTSIFDDAADLTIRAEIIFDNDMKETNNVAESNISIKEPPIARPRHVTAQQDANGNVALTWQAPDPEEIYEVTEDFQSYENGANETGLVGDWTLVNNNGATKGNLFQNASLASDGKAMAWEVIKPSEYGISLDEFKGPNGSLEEAFLLSTYNTDEENQFFPDNDDWLISPELPGVTQTISFAITALDAFFMDGAVNYEVLVSTTDRETANFSKVYEDVITKFGWQTVQVTLPEGTKYFAIRNISYGYIALAMMLGDISYLCKGVNVDAYHIYYEGMKIAAVVGDQTTYTVDADKVEIGERTFAISTVNDKGLESKPVTATINVAAGIQPIVVEDKPFDVYALDGKLIRKQTNSLNGLKGIYVINGKTVMIK